MSWKRQPSLNCSCLCSECPTAMQRWLCSSCNSSAGVKGGVGTPPWELDPNISVKYSSYIFIWHTQTCSEERLPGISPTRQAKAKMQPMESKSFSKGYVGRRGGSYCDPSVFFLTLLFFDQLFITSLVSCLSTEFSILHSQERKSLARKCKAHFVHFSGWSCLPWPDFLRDPYLCIPALTILIMAGSSVSIIRKY